MSGLVPIRGSDVSAMQGLVPWAAHAQQLACEDPFSFLRCAIGNEPYRDSQFPRNVEIGRAEGFVLAPYFFLYPLPHLDPYAQAEYHAKHAEYSPGKLLGAEIGDLPPMVDLEWPAPYTRLKDGTVENTWAKWKVDAKQMSDWALRYCWRLEMIYGCKPILYFYRYWWQVFTNGGASVDEFAQYMPCLADYFAKGRIPRTDEVPKLPKPWTGTTSFFCQHDGDGGLKLPNGVDADFQVFYGTRDEYNALRGLTRIPEIPKIDVAAASAGAMRILLDEQISAYRRERMTEDAA